MSLVMLLRCSITGYVADYVAGYVADYVAGYVAEVFYR
jgi:hypothetical protein